MITFIVGAWCTGVTFTGAPVATACSTCAIAPDASVIVWNRSAGGLARKRCISASTAGTIPGARDDGGGAG